MPLLGYKAQVEAHLSLFGDSANLDARYVQSLGQTYHGLWKPLWLQRMELLGDVGRLESQFGPFRDTVSVSARQVNGLRQTYYML
jgi:hypothetical protein